MPRITLILASVYMAVIGLALMIVPLKFGVGAVPADASPELIALMRLLCGPFLGIAVLDALSRNASGAFLKTVLIANAVGFGAVALNDVWGVISGEARDLARVFLVVHLAFAGAFLLSLRQAKGR